MLLYSTATRLGAEFLQKQREMITQMCLCNRLRRQTGRLATLGGTGKLAQEEGLTQCGV